MKKTMILTSMTLSLAFIACQKEEVSPKETSAKENVIQYNVENNNQSTRAHNPTTKPVFLVDHLEEWWIMYKLMHGYFIEGTSPDEKIDFLTNNQSDLELVLGEERMNNLIHGHWTMTAEGELEIGSVYTINFKEDGKAVELMNFKTVVGGDDNEDDDG